MTKLCVFHKLTYELWSIVDLVSYDVADLQVPVIVFFVPHPFLAF